MKWTRNRHGDRRLDLGHGLHAFVSYEGMECLPADAPRYNVQVFGRKLMTRADSINDGKRRAEAAARRWLQEALLRLNSGLGSSPNQGQSK